MKSQIPMNRKLRSLIIGITNYMKSQTLMNRKLRSLIIGITNAGRSQTPIFFSNLTLEELQIRPKDNALIQTPFWALNSKIQKKKKFAENIFFRQNFVKFFEQKLHIKFLGTFFSRKIRFGFEF